MDGRCLFHTTYAAVPQYANICCRMPGSLLQSNYHKPFLLSPVSLHTVNRTLVTSLGNRSIMSMHSISSSSFDSGSPSGNGTNSPFDGVPPPIGKPPRGKSSAPAGSPKSKTAPVKYGSWGDWHKNAPRHRRGLSFDSLQDLSAPIPLVPLVST